MKYSEMQLRIPGLFSLKVPACAMRLGLDCVEPRLSSCPLNFVHPSIAGESFGRLFDRPVSDAGAAYHDRHSHPCETD